MEMSLESSITGLGALKRSEEDFNFNLPEILDCLLALSKE